MKTIHVKPKPLAKGFPMCRSANVYQRVLCLTTAMLLCLVPDWGVAQNVVDEKGSGAIALIVPLSQTKLMSIKMDDLKRLYLGKKTRVGAVKIKACQLSAKKSARSVFDKTVLKMTPTELKSYWIKEGLKAGAKKPRTLNSHQAMLVYLSKNKSAMGYVVHGSLTEDDLKKVRVLSIEANGTKQNPGDEHYPLQIDGDSDAE